MPLIPLDIPPGVMRNGTDLEQSGRWRDANLVRWREGSLRPVGGWRVRNATAYDNPPRGMLAWQDLTSNRRLAAGTSNKLFVTSGSGTTTDISPAALVAGTVTAAVNTGYGGGFYGTGDYGVARPDIGTFGEATTWSLDNWGEYLVACSTADGRLVEWQLDTETPAAAIANAPTSNSGLVVTAERFLFALGAGGNPRKVQWSDFEDNTLWAAASTNQAGDIELQTPGQIQCGVQVRGQTLILTDRDAHSATYQGPPFIYSFERVGQACGTPSRRAVAVVDAGAFWMGQEGFFVYSGGAVADVACEVADYVFGDINRNQISLVHAVANAQYGEIWWFYPSGGSNECDRYVAFNYKEGHWAIGDLGRTSAVPRGVFGQPLWADASGNVYDHEVGFSYSGAIIFAETGPISLGAGDQVMSVTHLLPDEKAQGDVTATFKTRFYPNDTERSYGPYTMSAPTSVRFTGRQIRMRVEGARLADWRVGNMRVDAKPRGGR